MAVVGELAVDTIASFPFEIIGEVLGFGLGFGATFGIIPPPPPPPPPPLHLYLHRYKDLWREHRVVEVEVEVDDVDIHNGITVKHFEKEL